jgi:division protein CdvB (Snf7/Vps24/ESCRT-III family)
MLQSFKKHFRDGDEIMKRLVTKLSYKVQGTYKRIQSFISQSRISGVSNG